MRIAARSLFVLVSAILVCGVAAWMWSSRALPTVGGTDVPPAGRIGQAARDAQAALGQFIAGSGVGGTLSVEERQRRIRALVRQARTMAELIPRETFDLQAIAARVGRDPRKMHDWVRTQTVLVPYRGVLRHARGVLMDRVGNSLDRSLLLASLIEANGLSTRLARAQLSLDQARALEAQAFAARPSIDKAADLSDRTFLAVDAYAKEIGSDALPIREQLQRTTRELQDVSEQVHRRAAAQAAMLAKAVTPALSGSETDSPSEMLEAFRDHWWVQVQEGDAWIDLDPAVPDSGKTIVPAQETLAPAELPSEIHHSLQISVIIEQWDGTTLQERRAVTSTTRPSTMLGEVIRLQHVPMPWPHDLTDATADQQRRLRDAALGVREWLPVLTIGGKPISEASILETGDLNLQPGTKPSAAPSAGLLGGLAGGDPDSTAGGVLTAEWIEYVINAPGRPAQTIRREVFDLVGPAARAARTAPPPVTDAQRHGRALSLLGETEILASPAQLSSAFVSHLTASALVANEPVLTLLAENKSLSSEALAGLAKDIAPVPGVLHALAVARANPGRQPGGLLFVDRVNVLSRHVYLRADQTESVALGEAIDIVASEIASSHKAPVDRFAARVEQGVLDANLEAVFLGPNARAGVVDRYGVDPSERWVVVRDSQSADRLSASPDMRARIESDLKAGFVVVAPNLGDGATGWWRVDPRTGDTLNVGDRGWGQATLEYKVTTAIVLGASVGGVCALGASLDGRLTRREAAICVAAGGMFMGVGLGVAAMTIGIIDGVVGAGIGVFLSGALLGAALMSSN